MAAQGCQCVGEHWLQLHSWVSFWLGVALPSLLLSPAGQLSSFIFLLCHVGFAYVPCSRVNLLSSLLSCQPAQDLVSGRLIRDRFLGATAKAVVIGSPRAGVPFRIPEQLPAKSHCFQKAWLVNYISGINADLEKSHFERLLLQANAFKPNTLNGGCLRWADGFLLPGASPIANPPGWQGWNHLVGMLSVGIMRSVFHAPRSRHSDFSQGLHRSLILRCVV